MNIKKVKLSDVCVGKGCYGIPASAVPFSEELYTYLRITDINDDGTLNLADRKSVDDPKAKNYILKENDIVFARTGNSTGRSYFYDAQDGELVYAGFLIKFSLDPHKVNPKFIKYYAISEAYRGWIASFNTGSTRGNINAQTYANMEIPLPSRSQQDLTVDILSSLDSKIRWNAQINHNLEAQAQAIFKSWFVDFEPFQNGKFIDSELGSIPEGWRAGTLKEMLDIRYGKDHKKLSAGTIPVYGSGGLMRLADKALYSGESVLIPRKGTLNNVMRVSGDFWTVDTMFYSVPKCKGAIKFAFHVLRNMDLASMNSGSAVPSMTTDILNSIDIVVPPESVLASFEETTSALWNLDEANLRESNRLASLRDALLPKLMSGEIDVSEVEV